MTFLVTEFLGCGNEVNDIFFSSKAQILTFIFPSQQFFVDEHFMNFVIQKLTEQYFLLKNIVSYCYDISCLSFTVFRAIVRALEYSALLFILLCFIFQSLVPFIPSFVRLNAFAKHHFYFLLHVLLYFPSFSGTLSRILYLFSGEDF